MLKEYKKRKKISRASNYIKTLQSSLSRSESGLELYSDLLSVETRDIYTTGCLQLESVKILLEYRLIVNSKKIENISSNYKKVHDLNNYVLDIGGNIGFYARFFSRLFKSVVTLEPNPKTFELLELNTNSLSNVLALNLGASSSSGTKILRGSSKHSGGYKISNDAEICERNIDEMINEYEVLVVTYRDLMEQIQISKSNILLNNSHPNLIKIDVEGHELEVLKGLNLELFERLPSILLELNGSRNSREEIIDFLKEKNYTRFVTTTNLLAHGVKSRIKNLSILYTIGGMNLIMKSLSKNTIVVLDHPHLYRLEQLLVLGELPA